MERLTARDPAGNAYFPECFEEPCGGGGCTKDHCEFLDRVCDKLAGYEEQGEQEEKLLAESEAVRAELGRRLAAVQQELAEVKAERDEYYEHLRGLCFCCGHQNDGFDCHTKCYGHRRGSAWVYKGQKKEA